MTWEDQRTPLYDLFRTAQEDHLPPCLKKKQYRWNCCSLSYEGPFGPQNYMTILLIGMISMQSWRMLSEHLQTRLSTSVSKWSGHESPMLPAIDAISIGCIWRTRYSRKQHMSFLKQSSAKAFENIEKISKSPMHAVTKKVLSGDSLTKAGARCGGTQIRIVLRRLPNIDKNSLVLKYSPLPSGHVNQRV